MVITGEMDFRVGDERRTLGPGGTWRIRSDVPHEAVAGPQGAVVIDVGDGIAAEASPNVETVVMADLDLEVLRRNQRAGSVRQLQDRRKDLYQVLMRDGAPSPWPERRPVVSPGEAQAGA